MLAVQLDFSGMFCLLFLVFAFTHIITELVDLEFLKGATSRFVHEKFSLNFSSSSFAIRVNLSHP